MKKKKFLIPFFIILGGVAVIIISFAIVAPSSRTVRREPELYKAIEGTESADIIAIDIEPGYQGDTVIYLNGVEEDRIDGSDESIGIKIEALGGDDEITVEFGVDRNIYVDAGEGSDTVVSDQFGEEGPFPIDVDEIGTKGWEIYGGPGDDVLQGGGRDDLLDGGEGNDEIYGNEGDSDILVGGPGADTIHYGSDNVYFKGYTDTASEL